MMDMVVNVAVNVSEVRPGAFVHRDLFEVMAEVRQRLKRRGRGTSVSLHKGKHGLCDLLTQRKGDVCCPILRSEQPKTARKMAIKPSLALPRCQQVD
jgi:hypothetical protein